MIPFYGQKLNGNVAATEKELSETSRVLQLGYTPLTPAANSDQAATPVAAAQ